MGEDRQTARRGQGFDYSLIGGLFLLLANLAWGITVVRKYNRRFPADWKGQYYRELPSDATPAVVSYLMDFKIEPRDLVATLTDLVRKKHVTVEERKDPKGRKKPDYIFRLNQKNREELRPHEQSLVAWFFDELGKDGTLRLSKLKEYSNDYANAKAFRERFVKWQNEVKDTAEELGYVLVRKKTVNTCMLLATVLQIVLIFWLLPESWYWTFLCALPLPFFKPKRQRRTTLGNNEYRKWNAFKRFLRDYSQIASKEPLAVYLWQHYLVYAIPLGEAKKMESIGRIQIRGEDAALFLQTSSFWDGYDEWTTSIKGTIDSGKEPWFDLGDFPGGFSSGGGGGGGGGRGAF